MSILDIFRRSTAETDAPTQSAADNPIAVWLADTIDAPGYRRLGDCPEVVTAINVYAELISTMTIHLMSNGELGDTRVNNGLSRLVDIQPNPYMTKSTFYRAIVRGMLLGDGNQITLPVFTPDGLIDRLVPLAPKDVRLQANGEGYQVEYRRQRIYQTDEILHFRVNPDPDEPWRGTGLTVLLKDVLQSLSQANATKREILRRPMPSIIVRIDSNAEELASAEGRAELAKKYVDVQRTGDPWMIPADMMSIEQVNPMTINDLAIRDDLELSKTDVAMMLGVPAFMVGVGAFNKDEFNNFIRTRVRALAKVIEEELTAKLLIMPSWYFRLNARSLMAYDMGELVNVGQAMVDRTAMTRNEWRDLMGMSPREDMEELIILENYLPIDKIGQQSKLVKEE